MSLKFVKVTSVHIEGFDAVIPTREARAAIRKAGLRVVTRLKKRWRRSKRFTGTGQLLKSFTFRMKRGKPHGTIAPRGIRADADTHRKRKPMRNFAIGAFLSARQGFDLMQLGPEDVAFYRAELLKNLAAALERYQRKMGILIDDGGKAG